MLLSAGYLGCAETDETRTKEWAYNGRSIAVAGGEASTWVEVSETEGLLKLGVILTPDVLAKPANDVVVLPLPVEAQYSTLFDHVELQIATDSAALPYVALHLFAFSEVERATIGCGPEDFPAADRIPHDLFVDTGDGGCIPGRGYMALAAPGLPAGEPPLGGPAAAVGVDYGSGEVAGIALVFAYDQMTQRSALGRSVPGAQGVERALMWPSRVEADFNDATGNYEITLTDFSPVNGGTQKLYGF